MTGPRPDDLATLDAADLAAADPVALPPVWRPLAASELLQMRAVPPVLWPVLPARGIAVVRGPRGIGRTHVGSRVDAQARQLGAALRPQPAKHV